ncbi:chemotaxis protein CheX [Bacillus carboniphilus]|uniref:Chemotaxis protein CheX n=1 Tax=Bacillus carboniphilus TaxID=86663 RepID=A0ABN0VSB3_9BACI
MIGTKTRTSQNISEIFNEAISSLKNVVPLNHSIGKPTLIEDSIQIGFGVLIGVTGDMKGKLVFAGDTSIFSSIGEAMFGMPLEGEMLTSFSGELGNMIAGGFSTNIVHRGVQTDITSPTIMDGNSKVTGFKYALRVDVGFEQAGEMNVYLLVD